MKARWRTWQQRNMSLRTQRHTWKKIEAMHYANLMAARKQLAEIETELFNLMMQAPKRPGVRKKRNAQAS